MSRRDGIPDREARGAVLDAGRSFIVQAPAGSGKTELLIQRFLRLLSFVDEPEEVLAITFTRKAAGEMRSRVIGALRDAAEGRRPVEAHRIVSWELARNVLRDARRERWQIHRHPSRLSIGTIDSVNAWLAGRAPLGAGGNSVQSVTENPEALYAEATRAVLRNLAGTDQAARDVQTVLEHVDNDTGRFERLLTAMLPRRDQWLRQVMAAAGDPAAFEAPLRACIAHVLSSVSDSLASADKDELLELLAFAGASLRSQGSEHDLACWVGQQRFPEPSPGNLALWRSLAGLLLTSANGHWRSKVNAGNGFPPKTIEKGRMERFLARCAASDGELRQRLAEVRALPQAAYGEQRWRVLQALMAVLRLAAVELKLVFSARAKTDFPEVAAAALQAVGAEDEISGLGLALDHRIRHILVDEFQDTSLPQFELLCRLTAGWEVGDGRTIFLVGDPMQSIYRFRQAEVGVFMRVRDEGVGRLRPEFIRLVSNFRSTPALVEWVNSSFERIFPQDDDPQLGRVGYAASVHGNSDNIPALSGVVVHWLAAGDKDLEARATLDIVRGMIQRPGDETICILVRSRSHATRLMAALRAAGLPFVAPEIEDLERSSVAHDLLALTRAILHPADRLAWIGVLRAPWCGLSLDDLTRLVADDRSRTIPEMLVDKALIDRLSLEGRGRIERLVPVIDSVARARGRRSLRDLVEGAWLDLGGPATLREEAEIESATSFLEILDNLDVAGDCRDLLEIGQQMRRRKGSLGSGGARIQVMTMHKAKGLEFDNVILPGLSRPPRGDEPPLLAWQEVPVGDGRGAVILAPISPAGEERDELYRYLMRMERQKQTAETERLLYVACTRARKHLHLLATIQVDADEDEGRLTVRKPRMGSLLERLWPALEAEACAQAPGLARGAEPAREESQWVQPRIRRFPAGWQPPPLPVPLQLREPGPTSSAAPIAYEWASERAMHIGTVVHRWLQRMAEQGVAGFDRSRLAGLRREFQRELSELGMSDADLEPATDRIEQALALAAGDEKARWILDPRHNGAACELALTICDGNAFRHVVIDRTFVADGIRWVIDYKTSTHEGGDLETFLERESDRHREQLQLYRRAAAALGPQPVRTALYFPLLRAFREVSPDGPARP
jgi:ATP-dependent exoDNAse (exonuclease V) beta subunit